MAADQVGQSRTAVASDRGDGFRMGRWRGDRWGRRGNRHLDAGVSPPPNTSRWLPPSGWMSPAGCGSAAGHIDVRHR